MLMPDANIAVAHGQMTERDLEETMLSLSIMNMIF